MTVSVKVPHGSSEGQVHLGGQVVEGLTSFPGLPTAGWIRIAANVADVETVTVGSVVFEFDRAANGVVSGRVPVTSHSDDTPANASNALITAINARNDLPVVAVDHSDNIILLVGKTVGTGTVALAETMAGSGNIVSAAATSGGAAQGNKRVVAVSRVPTANEVTAGLLFVPLKFVPTNVLVQVRVTSTGAFTAWDGKWLIGGGSNNPYVVVDNAGDVDWAETSTVHITIFE